MTKLRILLIGLVLLAVTGVFVSADATPGVTGDTVTIGSFQALSGPVAAVGVPMRKGMDVYFNWLNSNGGVNGRKIKLLVEDDGFVPSRTVAAVKKMVEQDNVFAVVGGLGTPGCLAVMDYLNESKVPFVYQGSGASKLAFPPKKYIFPVQPNYTFEGSLFARYAVRDLKAKRVAVVYENTDIGKEGFEGVKAEMAKQKKEIAFDLVLQANETDFSTYVLKLMGAKPDVVIVYATVKPTAGFLKQAHMMGLKATYVTSYINSDLSLITLAGPAAEGVIVAGWVPLVGSDIPEFKEFDKDYAKFQEIYQKAYPGEIPSGYATAGWIAGEVFAEGLRRAGKNPTRESLVKGLEGMKHWKGLMAKDISYGKDERIGKTSMCFMKVENGAFKMITGWVR